MTPLDAVHVDELLDKTVQAGCRELQLRAGQSPQTHSCHESAEDSLLAYEAPSPLDIQQMVYAIMTDEQIRQLEREEKLSFSYSLARRVTFVVHVICTKAGMEADFLVAKAKNALSEPPPKQNG